MDFALFFEMDTTQMSKNFDQMSIIGFQFYFVGTSKSIKLYLFSIFFNKRKWKAMVNTA